MTASRKPAGTPVGGQFAAKAHTEPSADVVAANLKELAEARYVAGLEALREETRYDEDGYAVFLLRTWGAQAIYPGIDWECDEDDPAADDREDAWIATGAKAGMPDTLVGSSGDAALEAHRAGLAGDDRVAMAARHHRAAVLKMMELSDRVATQRLIAALAAARPDLPSTYHSAFVGEFFRLHTAHWAPWHGTPSQIEESREAWPVARDDLVDRYVRGERVGVLPPP